MPYIKNTDIFACPNDRTRTTSSNNVNFWDIDYRKKAIPRTYQFTGNIVTVEAGSALLDANTGLATYPYPLTSTPLGRNGSQIDESANTIALVEVWGPTMLNSDSGFVGSPSSAAFVLCDTWKLPGRPFPAQTASDRTPSVCSSVYHAENTAPGVGHGKGGNYALADGHAKFLTWGQVRNNDFAMFKLKKSATVFNP